MTIIFNACPDCGCFDLRMQKWVEGWRCFKCGLTEQEYDNRQRELFIKGIFEKMEK